MVQQYLTGKGLMIFGILSVLNACSTMRSHVDINASSEQVWEVLTDFESYPQWNPFFVDAHGKPVVGEHLDVTMQPVGKGQHSFSPKILKVNDKRCLVWRGRLIMPFLFDGTHHFTIEKVDANTVRFTQYEEFSGILVPFAGFEPYRAGWLRMNEALKERAERGQEKAPVRRTATAGAAKRGIRGERAPLTAARGRDEKHQ